MVTAGLIFYNEAPIDMRDHQTPLWGLLSSLALFKIDRVIAIDGAFEDYPHEVPFSTDKSHTILRHWAESESKTGMKIEVYESSKAWSNEAEKRNEIFKRLQDGEWLIIIDADERLVLPPEEWGDWLNGDYDCLQTTHLYQPQAEGQQPMIAKGGNPRVIHFKTGMKYKYNHYSIYGPDGGMIHLPPYRMAQSDIIIADTFHASTRKRITDKVELWTRRLEQANGTETFQCIDCKRVFRLREGENMQCSRCLSHRLASMTVEEMQKRGLVK